MGGGACSSWVLPSHDLVATGEKSPHVYVAGKATLLCVKGGNAFPISRDQVGCSAWQLLGAPWKE